MDVQLKELIDKIKIDGVKSAEDSAKTIIAEAEKKADQIVSNAEKKANDVKESALAEAEVSKQAGISAVKQSARDLVIDLKKEIEGIFDSLIKTETTESLKGDELANAIVAVLGNWNKDDVSDLKVLLPSSEEENVKKSIIKKFSDAVKAGLEIKPQEGLDAGFKLSEKDGNVYYDFTAEGVGQMMAEYLSPQLAEIVKDVKES
ncbi:MAG: V-type ATP synthase subunit E [Spirochaetaceae bacterium]